MPELRAIVAAAGEGLRFGAPVPKQLVELAGRPVIDWSVERLLAAASEVVVAVPADLLDELEEHFADRPRVRCVSGAATRWGSVRRALEALPGEASDLIAIHDGARPALAAGDLERVVAAAAERGAAVLGRPASDTVKRVRDGLIEATVDRSELFRAETPQVFRRDVLARAAELADREGLEPTDEASLVEALGDVEIVAVAAERPNPKLTEPGDRVLLEALLEAPGASTS